MKRFSQFANSTHVMEDMQRLFTLIALNCALRNGDAHLKNFGIVYDKVQCEARLATVYDVVTTSVYIPNCPLAKWLDQMADRKGTSKTRRNRRRWHACEDTAGPRAYRRSNSRDH